MASDKKSTSINELSIDPEQLWKAGDRLRGSIVAAEYKHVVLGLIFLKYIFDAFLTRRDQIATELK
jgi:type I restriction enzyme M protein